MPKFEPFCHIFGCHGHKYAYLRDRSHMHLPWTYTKLVWRSFGHCHASVMNTGASKKGDLGFKIRSKIADFDTSSLAKYLFSHHSHVGCWEMPGDAWSICQPFRPHGPTHLQFFLFFFQGSSLVCHGFMSVFIVFQGSMLFFYGSRWVLRLIHCSWSVFVVPVSYHKTAKKSIYGSSCDKVSPCRPIGALLDNVVCTK